MTYSAASKSRIGVTETAEAGIGRAKTEARVAEAGAGESGVLGESRVYPRCENQVIEAGIHEVRVKTRILKIAVKAGVLKIGIEAGIEERTEGASAESTSEAASKTTPAAEETRASLQHLGKEAGLSCKAARKSYGWGTESADTSESSESC